MSIFVSVAPGGQAPIEAPALRSERQQVLSSKRAGQVPLWLMVGAGDLVVASVMLGGAASLGAAALPAAVLVLLLWLALLAVAGGFEHAPGASVRQRLGPVVRAGCALGLLCWVGTAYVEIGAAPGSLVLGTAALVLAALVVRLAAVLAARWSSTAGIRLLVAGDPEVVAGSLGVLDSTARSPWQVVAARVSEAGVGFDDTSVPVAVGTDDLTSAARDVGAQAVLLLPGPRLDPAQVRRICWEFEDSPLDLYVGAGLLDAAPTHLRVTTVGALDAVQVHRPVLHGPARMVKAVLERLVAAALLLLLLPVLVCVALWVCWDSPGPALFRQRRVGRDGREFTMLKFRTMDADAEAARGELIERNEADGALFKVRSDPRITRVGRVLRRYSLDELPQLLNVVRGEMALVGPRPALPCEVAGYDLDPRRRLAVKPGLTGLWQVSGRSDLSWDESVWLDLHYVDHWSLRLDLLIACRTVGAVLGHRGAY